MALTTAASPSWSLKLDQPARDLQDVVDAQRAKDSRSSGFTNVSTRSSRIRDLRPGNTLAALAAIEGFPLFISTTFDPLLPRAVESASARRETRRAPGRQHPLGMPGRISPRNLGNSNIVLFIKFSGAPSRCVILSCGMTIFSTFC